MPAPRRVAFMLDLDWPYKRHVELFAGAQEYAREHGWHSIIDEFVGSTLESNTVRYDGVITRATKLVADQAKKRDVPLVNVWFGSPILDQLPGVFPDFAASGRLRAELLLSRGFRNFAALASRPSHSHDVEVAEFNRVVREHGFSSVNAKAPLRPTSKLSHWRKAEQVIADWMDTWQLPTGVFAGAEAYGRIIAQMCLVRGLRVPEDVAITCGDNEEGLCEHPRPSLSSVERGYYRIGYEAAQMLDRLIDKKQKAGKGRRKKSGTEVEHVLLNPKGLVLRESTDFFAVDDALVASALEFIATNSHKSIGPLEVAKAVATQSRTLQRRFRKYLDRPIATEIRRVRIERAKRELAQSENSIASISAMVGFGPAMRMYQVFVREVGITPSEYRLKVQGEKD